MKTNTCKSVAIALIMFLTVRGPVSGQPVQHVVDDPRPLSQALDIIEQQCKCVVTYEAPQYDSSQVVDVTDRVNRKPGPATRRILVPHGVPFAFPSDPAAAVHGPQDLVAPVEVLLEQFNGSGNTTQFRLDRTDSVLHVVPTKGSILDVPVTLADTEATADKVLAAFTGREPGDGQADRHGRRPLQSSDPIEHSC